LNCEALGLGKAWVRTSIDRFFNYTLGNIATSLKLKESDLKVTTSNGKIKHKFEDGDSLYVRIKNGLNGGSSEGLSDTELAERMGSVGSTPNYSHTEKVNEKGEKMETLGGVTGPNAIYLDHLQNVVAGKFDTFCGEVWNDVTQIQSNWATAMKTKNLITNYNGHRSFGSWREEVVSVVATGNETDPGVSVGHHGTVILATAPCYPKALLSAPWAEMSKAIDTGGIVTLSQFVRINTTLCNGDAMNRVLVSMKQQYMAGRIGSFSSILTKLELYIHQFVPLWGSENNSVSNIHPRPYPGDMLEAPGNFNLLNAVGTTTPVPAKLTTVDEFTRIRAGLAVQNIPPPGWEPNTWGATTALVPVDFTFLNQPASLAAWTLAFLEYPYKQVRHFWDYVNDEGELYVGSGDYRRVNASRVKIPGVHTNVLFIVCNLFNVGADNLVLEIGPAGSTIALNVNGNNLNGAQVDIEPALSALFADTGTFLASMQQARLWWKNFYGNKSDHLAAQLAVAGSCYSLGIVSQKHNTDIDGFISNSTGLTSPSWNTSGLVSPLAIVQEVASSCTYPDHMPVFNDTQLQMGTYRVVRFIGQLDPIAAVDVMWGALTFVEPCENFQTHIAAVVSRSRFLARIMTTVMDSIVQATGASESEMSNALAIPGVMRVHFYTMWKKVYDTWAHGVLARLHDNISLYYNHTNMGDYTTPVATLFFSATRLRTWARKPRYEQEFYLQALTNTPRKFVAKQMAVGYDVVRESAPVLPVVGNHIEYTQLCVRNQNTMEGEGLLVYASTQLMTMETPLAPRVGLYALLVSKLANVRLEWAFNIDTPSSSRAQALTMSLYAGAPSYSIVDTMWDAPYQNLPPCKSLSENRILNVAFDAFNPNLFAQLTRSNQIIYQARLCPDDSTCATFDVTDGHSILDDETEAQWGTKKV